MEQSYLERVLEQASDGDTQSQLYLGWAYSRHGNQPRNDAQAELWLRKAEQSGDPLALRQLARFIYDNRREEALQLAERLIEKDDFYGFYMMGDIYKLGVLGVEKGMPLPLVPAQSAGM
ncbi:MAG: hypothetical protein SH859_10900 [Hyphomicrobium aestuarii]|nr:hypothetical protein [Hyphomicrobium aestuarii]